MSQDTDEVVGILYAEALYKWADRTVESGDFTAKPFAEVTANDELAIGAIIDLEGIDASKTTETGLDIILNTLTPTIKVKEDSHARSQQ